MITDSRLCCGIPTILLDDIFYEENDDDRYINCNDEPINIFKCNVCNCATVECQDCLKCCKHLGNDGCEMLYPEMFVHAPNKKNCPYIKGCKQLTTYYHTLPNHLNLVKKK